MVLGLASNSPEKVSGSLGRNWSSGLFGHERNKSFWSDGKNWDAKE